MSLWSKIKNKLNINRSYIREEIWLGGKKVELKDLEFQENKHYVYHKTLDKFQLLTDLKVTYYWKKNGVVRATTIMCKTGFIWNGASIPKRFQGLIGGRLEPEFALASCIHDKAVKMGLGHYPESRIFYQVLKTRSGRFNIPKWKEKAMYLAVYAWSIYSS